jgi:predicted transposase/invertase (TIGR01784 family)
MLPLPEDRLIEDLNYLPTELLPDIPTMKNSIVDVRCKDIKGRHFTVEMQMIWIPSFKSRMLYNISKAYTKQLQVGQDYKDLQPVYGLALINGIFDKENPEFYHHYQMVNNKLPEVKLEDMHMVFYEIQKFVPKTYAEKKLMVLWMRYMTEINRDLEMISEELLAELQSVPEIAEALEIAKASSYTIEELEQYDKFWDTISTQRNIISDAEERGIKIGEARGEYNKMQDIAQKMKSKGIYTTQEIAEITGLSIDEINWL